MPSHPPRTFKFGCHLAFSTLALAIAALLVAYLLLTPTPTQEPGQDPGCVDSVIVLDAGAGWVKCQDARAVLALRSVPGGATLAFCQCEPEE